MIKEKFLTNQSSIPFLEKLKKSILSCDHFKFSVSFIKYAGLLLLKREIEDALTRGVVGEIITSTYQNFTDIESLNFFLSLSKKYPNFQCHLDFNSFGDSGFHTKGYIFVYKDHKELLVGSSNITRFALLKNIEWNISLESNQPIESIEESIQEFHNLWNQTKQLDTDLIEQYRLQLAYSVDRWDMDYFSHTSSKVIPNRMQTKALKEIIRLRSMGQQKALIVSSTASGKTYLSCFDAKNYGAKHLLFLVHRENILLEAMESFRRVLGNDLKYGLFTGNKQELDSDYIFASVSMMSNHLDYFSSDEFDYIVADEAHHIVSPTYRKVIEYFHPGFLLGLTATPERLDEKDVFDVFDQNVPYELRLRDALLNDIVVPFHYYGIRDEHLDYGIDNVREIARQISSDENTDLIISEIQKHKHSGGKLKAIAFCISIEHTKTMAAIFNEKGFVTTYLTGASSIGDRNKAFSDLQNESHPLQIVCAIDILNEGIDIPGINMVLFLRPTDSPTIFIQQLGRGLRKYPGKDYLTVLDFIGNDYRRSMQIAFALGQLSPTSILEKTMLKEMIQNDFIQLGLPINIVLDEKSKEEILGYIEKGNFNTKKYLESDYMNFKKYLGIETYPKHMDYLNSELAPNFIRFIKSSLDGSKNSSYYSFLKKIGEENIVLLPQKEERLLNQLSDYLPLVRPDEFLIVKSLLSGPLNKKDIFSKYDNYSFLGNQFDHALELLVSDGIITKEDQIVTLNIDLENSFEKEYFLDLIEYGLKRFDIEFDQSSDLFSLYNNYYKEQIMMKLCKKRMFVKGTLFENGNVFIFANLKKDDNTEEHLKYRDKFLSPNTFQWESETETTLESKIGNNLVNSKEVFLFIRKMESEDGITLPFTYLGKGKLNSNPEISDNPKKTLIFKLKLENEIPEKFILDFNIPKVSEFIS